jgi:hypothetical protein
LQRDGDTTDALLARAETALAKIHPSTEGATRPPPATNIEMSANGRAKIV